MRRRGKFGNPDQLAFAWPLAPPSPEIDLAWASRVLGAADVANDTEIAGPYTYQAIAQLLGLSQSCVWRTERVALEKVRRRLTVPDPIQHLFPAPALPGCP